MKYILSILLFFNFMFADSVNEEFLKLTKNIEHVKTNTESKNIIDKKTYKANQKKYTQMINMEESEKETLEIEIGELRDKRAIIVDSKSSTKTWVVNGFLVGFIVIGIWIAAASYEEELIGPLIFIGLALGGFNNFVGFNWEAPKTKYDQSIYTLHDKIEEKRNYIKDLEYSLGEYDEHIVLEKHEYQIQKIMNELDAKNKNKLEIPHDRFCDLPEEAHPEATLVHYCGRRKNQIK